MAIDRDDNESRDRKPDAATSYERARPKEQSPSGRLDQETPPPLEKQDTQEEQNEAPNIPPRARKTNRQQEDADHEQ